jgi:hypothetical protein
VSFSVFTTLALRTAGFVLIVVPLLNLFFGLFPPKFEDIQWQLAVSSQIVEQSLIPLGGVVLVIASFWVNHVSQNSGRSNPTTRMITFGFASLMGLLLVLVVPLQIHSVMQLHNQAVSEVNKNLDENQPQFKKTVEETVERQKQGIQMLMQQSPQQIQAAVQAGQISPEQAGLLEQFRADPKNLDAFLKSERKNIEKQLKDQMQGQKQVQTDKLREGWKMLFRVCITSLAIAIAYLTIGWNGFRKLQANE